MTGKPEERRPASSGRPHNSRAAPSQQQPRGLPPRSEIDAQASGEPPRLVIEWITQL